MPKAIRRVACVSRQDFIARLERWLAPKRERRIVVQYEGPGSERFPQPTQQEMEENSVITVRFVEAKDGRPVDPTEPAR
jgi:hypothetical protein